MSELKISTLLKIKRLTADTILRLCVSSFLKETS